MPAPSLSPTSSIGRPPSTRAAAAGRRSRQRALPHVQRQQHPAARARTERHPPTSTCSRPTPTPAPSAAYPLKGSRRAPTPTTTATLPRTPAAARGHRRRRAPQTQPKGSCPALTPTERWQHLAANSNVERYRPDVASNRPPSLLAARLTPTPNSGHPLATPAPARRQSPRRALPRQTASAGRQHRPQVPHPRQRKLLPAAKTDGKRHPSTTASSRPPPEPAAGAAPTPTPAPAGCQSQWRLPATCQPAPRRHQTVGANRQSQRQAPAPCQAAPRCRQAATTPPSMPATGANLTPSEPTRTRHRGHPLTRKTPIQAASDIHRRRGPVPRQRRQRPATNADVQRRSPAKQQQPRANTDKNRLPLANAKGCLQSTLTSSATPRPAPAAIYCKRQQQAPTRHQTATAFGQRRRPPNRKQCGKRHPPANANSRRPSTPTGSIAPTPRLGRPPPNARAARR